ncbi:unnamed protein product [Moneuplotes crassus]|uniref:Uncharacterized protein n=1 Tax=Euplotes crassus TaxID=5936 RepID=A0AAD1Y825_EUPCR|nr:unnamed protein product [Moneuplotes crassus]
MEHTTLKVPKGAVKTIFSPTRATKRKKGTVRINGESSHPDPSPFSPGGKIRNIKLLNKIIKKLKRRQNSNSQLRSNMSSHRFKSVSPNGRRFKKFLKLPSAKKIKTRYFSPNNRKFKINSLLRRQTGNMKAKGRDKFTPIKEPKRKFNFKSSSKLQKRKTKEKSKIPSNSGNSETFRAKTTYSSRQNPYENKRYYHFSKEKFSNSPNSRAIYRQTIKQDRAHAMPPASSRFPFEVYISQCPEEGDFNILNKYLDSDTFDAMEGKRFPELISTENRGFNETIDSKEHL